MLEEDHATIEWSEFAKQSIRQYQLPHFELKYPSRDPISQSAVTAINEALLKRAIASGYPGIVISICDYSREALAFSFSRAIGNILNSDPAWDFNTRYPEEGQLIALSNIVVEYKGTKLDDNFGTQLRFKQKGSNKNDRSMTRSVPLIKLPTPQPCASGATPTTSRQAKLSDIQKEYNALPKLARELIDRASGITSSVIMASSASPYLNTPPHNAQQGIYFIWRPTKHPCLRLPLHG